MGLGAQFPGPDRTVFTEESGKGLIQQGPLDWYGTLVAFWSRIVRGDLYEVGGALADVNDLDWCVNQLCKVLQQSREKQNKGVHLGDSEVNATRLVSSQSLGGSWQNDKYC